MWNMFKKLFGRAKKEQPVERMKGGDVKVTYIYPKTPLHRERPIVQRRESGVIKSSVKEWIQSCREVDTVLGRLSVGY